MVVNAKSWVWMILCAALVGFVCGMKVNYEPLASIEEDTDIYVAETAQRQILLYALPENYLSMPAEQIPHYRCGELRYYTWQEYENRASGGHSPWMGDPLSAVPIFCQNLFEEYLTPSDYVDNYGPGIIGFETPRGTTVQQLSKETTDGVQTTVIEINVPEDGCYTITFQVPPEDVWPGYMGIVTKILFEPKNSFE